jgi:antitoxin component of RelBE/YafQ-DinJ toxin-antitoxin module
MTSQLLTRVPTELKQQFKMKAENQGFSMDYLINVFIKTYTENPSIVQTYIDDDAFDEIVRRSFATPEAKKASESLFKAIKSA